MNPHSPPSDKDDISTALGLLRDSLSEEEQRIRSEGAKAMQGGDYDTAAAVIEFAKRLLTFQKKVQGLVGEWDELEDLRDTASPAVQEIVSKKFFGKRKKGEVTPHTAFYCAILESLVEMGGSGKTRDVLDRVGGKMKGVLKPIDYAVLPSDGKSIRWRNSAQWAPHEEDQERHLGDFRQRPGVAAQAIERETMKRAFSPAPEVVAKLRTSEQILRSLMQPGFEICH